MNCFAMSSYTRRSQSLAIPQTRKETKDPYNEISKIILTFPGDTNFSETHINAANDVLSIVYSKDIHLNSTINLAILSTCI